MHTRRDKVTLPPLKLLKKNPGGQADYFVLEFFSSLPPMQNTEKQFQKHGICQNTQILEWVRMSHL